MNLVAGDDLPRSLGKHQQNYELLRLKLYRDAALPQLTIDWIKLKRAEANYALLSSW
jgi:hypothetical protein